MASLLVSSIAPLKRGDDALKGRGVLAPAHSALIGDGDLFLARAIENGLPRLRGELLHGRIQREAVLSAHGAEILHGDAVIVVGIEAHGVQRALPQRQLLIGEENIRADLHQRSQTGAGWARAERAVEGEHAGRKLLDADAAVRAGIVLAEQQLPLIEQVDQHGSAGAVAGGFQRVGEALAELLAGADDEPVNDQLDGMLLFLIKVGSIVQLIHFPVHANADEAAFAGLLQQLDMLALSCADDGGQHLHPRSLGVGA